MENLNAEQVKAWADTVGPTFMAFIGFAVVVAFLIVPLARRDKKEGGNAQADIGIYARLSKVETQHEVLWDDWKQRQRK